MTHLAPTARTAAAAPLLALQQPPLAALRPPAPRAQRSLDRERLQAGIARRRQEILNLELALVAECEQAAIKGMGRHVQLDDRSTWDAPMWKRYVAAAAALEPDYGPRLAQLYRQIDQLQRLMDLPFAA